MWAVQPVLPADRGEGAPQAAGRPLPASGGGRRPRHGAHPQGCSAYVCSWLVSPALGEHWRPDISGFIVNLQGGGRLITLEVDPDRPHAWRAPAYLPQIRTWAAGLAEGRGVLVFSGGQAMAVFPDQDLDLGAREDGAAYVFGYRRTLQGPAPEVRIRSPGGGVRSVTGTAIGAPARA